jgi:acyl transferase domain-containing protein
MGDSIEIGALTKAFRANSDEKNFCAIGSVKSNVGHLDAASGIAALIKTVLSLEHKAIPASINFTRPNPQIDFVNSPFYVNTQLRSWPSGNAPRRAGVHSFGIGGTNAHIVVEEAPASEASTSSRSHQLVVFSARSKASLQAATASFISHFGEYPDLNLADAAYTCHVGRREFAQRQFLVCRDAADAAGALAAANEHRVLKATTMPGERSLAFLFPGEAAKHVNTGAEIYESEPTFRKHIDHCSELLEPHLGLNLRDMLYPGAHQASSASPNLTRTQVAQLSTFVFEYALAQLWMEWGVRPQVMMGNGVGEYVAGCVAEVFSLDDALRLLTERMPMTRDSAPATATAKIILRPPKIPFISNATGTWITSSAATDPSYWITPRHGTGHLAEGLGCLLGASNRTFLEVGAGCTMAEAIQHHPAMLKDHVILSSLPCQPEPTSETASMLNALGRLWLLGDKIDWLGFWSNEKRHRVSLPPYAFDRKRYWVEPQRRFAFGKDSPSPILKEATSKGAELLPGCEANAGADYAGPTDNVEAGVAEIWQKLLGVERVGVYDNFFALGGHSMLGAQLLAALRSAFQVEIPLPSLFEVPTVAGMAERIRAFR